MSEEQRTHYKIGRTTIAVRHDVDRSWEYEVRSLDPGIHDDYQSYHSSHEEALECAKKHIRKCVESAIQKRISELEVLRDLAVAILEVKP